jgi:hypothetical protein
MQFQTSDEHSRNNPNNCFVPSPLSRESVSSSEPCPDQGLISSNSRVIHTSPRIFRIWSGNYTSRHELLFFPNDDLDTYSEEEEEEADPCVLEEESLTEDEETWQVGESEVDKQSVIIPSYPQNCSDRNTPDWESSAVSEDPCGDNAGNMEK